MKKAVKRIKAMDAFTENKQLKGLEAEAFRSFREEVKELEQHFRIKGSLAHEKVGLNNNKRLKL